MTSNKGRPSHITNNVVNKLKEAFKIGLNTSEACRYGGISRQIFYNKINSDSEFLDTIERSKDHLKLQALGVIGAYISKGDLPTAKWYLERKYRKEFSEDEPQLQHGQEPSERDDNLLRLLQAVRNERISANKVKSKI